MPGAVVGGVAAVFAVGQGLEGFVLTPRIVGRRIGLHPVVVMLAVLIGGSAFGFLGVLLGTDAFRPSQCGLLSV